MLLIVSVACVLLGVGFYFGLRVGRLTGDVGRRAGADARARRSSIAQRGAPSLVKREPMDSLRRTATHEAGHAVANWYCTSVSRVSSATIVPDVARGLAGVVHSSRSCAAVEDAWCAAVTSLAGIAAEVRTFRDFRTGPSASDLMEARRLVRHHGLDRVDPPWSRVASDGDLGVAKFFAEPLGDAEARAVGEALAYARVLVTLYGAEVARVADLLVEEGTLDESRLRDALGARPFVRVLRIFRAGFFIRGGGGS